MPRYVIAASPLVKIYLKDWEDRLTENPDLIFDDDPANPDNKFSFSVATGTSGFKLDFNRPMLVFRPKPGSSYQADEGRSEKIIQLPNANMQSEGKEIESLYGWLIGEMGHSRLETDIFGIVPFDTGIDLVDRVDQMAALEALLDGDPKAAVRAKKELDKIQLDTARRVAEVRNKVKKDSEARIKRAMKVVHNNLIRQWQINSESNMGKYPPSVAEALGAHALNAELKAKAEKGKALFGKMNDLMSNVSV